VNPGPGALLVDDHLLLQLLLGDEPSDLRPNGATISTTGLWYHRLCRAVSNTNVTGSMSRQLGQVSNALAEAAVHAVVELPETIGLVSLRSLGWPMAKLLSDGERLNLLSLEALAAATHLGAEICLSASDDNAPLLAAATRRGVGIRTVQ
jgi:hypothetical protein